MTSTLAEHSRDARAKALPINPRSVFADVNAVRISRGSDADSIFAFVDSGKYLWVWNVSLSEATSKTPIRELRFWIEEIIHPESVQSLDLDAVLDRIAPASRQRFYSTELGRILLVSRPTAVLIAAEMGCSNEGHMLWVARQSFIAWLRSRWIGGLYGH